MTLGSLSERKAGLFLWVFAFFGVMATFLIMNVALLELYGQIKWTGVSYAAVSSIVTNIVNGASITNAVGVVVGVALAGPIVAALTAIGRGMIIRWVRRRGIRSVVNF